MSLTPDLLAFPLRAKEPLTQVSENGGSALGDCSIPQERESIIEKPPMVRKISYCSQSSLQNSAVLLARATSNGVGASQQACSNNRRREAKILRKQSSGTLAAQQLTQLKLSRDSTSGRLSLEKSLANIQGQEKAKNTEASRSE